MLIKPTDNYKVEIILPGRWYRQSRYRMLRDLKVGDVNIPQGFVTDGATVPIFLRWAFPPVGRYFPAAVAHDYLLMNGVNWATANATFRNALKHCNIPAWQRVLMGAATSAYGTCKEFTQLIKRWWWWV